MNALKTFFLTLGTTLKDFFAHPWAHIKKLKDKPGFNSILASLFSILVGIVVATLLMLIINPTKTFRQDTGILEMLSCGFSSDGYFVQVIYMAAPLLMTGLAVGFAFKTGLFNIGGAGQVVAGGFLALVGAIVFRLPWYVDLMLAAVGGALWGAIPGLFKAFLNVNEVITGIMFNWLGLYLVNLILSNTPVMLANYYGPTTGDRTVGLDIIETLYHSSPILPQWGLNALFPNLNSFELLFLSNSMIIAILIAIVVAIILNKTTFGYELKACGFNKDASDYAGINSKRNIILSMAISGALAGIGGGLFYLSGNDQLVILKTLPSIGFNGIPVALLGFSNPIGIIFSAFFIGYISIGGNNMQPSFATEFVDIVVAVIIYLSAFSLLFKQIIDKYLLTRKKKKAEKPILPAEPKSQPEEALKEGEGQ